MVFPIVEPPVEGLFNLKYGVAGVCVMLCLLFLLKVVELWMSRQEKRNELSEESVKALTKAADKLSYQMESLDRRLVLTEESMKKVDLDLKRFYSALKLTAGERWPAISEAIQKELRL